VLSLPLLVAPFCVNRGAARAASPLPLSSSLLPSSSSSLSISLVDGSRCRVSVVDESDERDVPRMYGDASG